MQVVGQTVLPGLATAAGSDKAGLGVGALLSASGFDRFSPDFGKAEYVFRLQQGSTPNDFRRFLVHLDPAYATVVIDAAFHPAGVVSVQRLRSTPTVLAGLVVAMLAAAVGNALVVAIRRRRHDLAVLRTMGLTSGQVTRTVLWQAATVGTVAAVVGLPLGVVLGRWTWRLLSVQLGTIPVRIVPVGLVGSIGAATVAVALAVGLVPGYRAGRARVTTVLRSE